MKWKATSWLLIKDAAQFGMGMWIIYRQVLATAPSDLLLTIALVLIVSRAQEHAKVVLSARTGGQHSSSEPGLPGLPELPSSSEEGAGIGD